ncbi:DUF805 domain-containing protein [Isoptericola sp. b408]|uniref:DUF805 domain-containing protein n=1 Tax=Isoptericola sp. b408 TaxID=3064653 RepID=UPI00271318BC|nr:DUF805 domain-containing protein [Isoptericola sp. b408]MDO8149809.1 DUF805 domain-containing protein [Isoptericola sp. b408]
MGFGTAVTTVLSKYATFSGRARRSEFWWWALFTVLLSIVVNSVVLATGGISVDPQTMLPVYGPTYGLSIILSLAVLLPSLAVTVRRLHDTDRSGLWWFIGLVPFVGWIVLLVFTVQVGTPGANRFGPDPKAAVAPDTAPTAAAGTESAQA